MKYSTKHARRAGIAFGIIFGLAFLPFDPLLALAIGGAVGALVGFLVLWILRGKERRWAKLCEPYEAEGIVHHAPAGCAIGPGYLILTSKRLVWIPLAQHDRHKRIEIGRTAITQVRKASGFYVDLHIAVRTGETIEFFTRDHKRWVDELRIASVQAANQ